VIGTVTDTGRMELVWNGATVADIPLDPLADEAPLYERPYTRPHPPMPLTDVPESTDIAADLLKLMASPALASRRWVWEQYDQSVGADTVQRPGGDAAVVRVHGTRKALAMTTDCTPRYCCADPYEGGKQAVAEAYRNLCAVGARPLAITNCLNFGNPQRPEIMGQFVACVEGMAEACRALDFPVVSGNVSLYNETKADDGSSQAILPTPAIGGVGLLDDWAKSATIGFKERGQTIWLVGTSTLGRELGQSLWLQEVHGRKAGSAPIVDLPLERFTAEFVRSLIEEGVVNAAHDISDGGMLVSVAEMALAGGIGAEICLEDADPTDTSLAAAHFGEDQGRYLVTTTGPVALRQLAEEAGTKATVIGTTGFVSQANNCEGIFCESSNAFVSLADLRAAHEGFFPNLMGADAALA
jgi:phosphoribosylformylglycinamidine synthase subunit PurL